MRTEVVHLNAEVEAFLADAQLRVADLASSRSLNLLGFQDGALLVGVVGVEAYGGVGLLRSLAVKPTHRNIGLGVALVSSAEGWAAEQGVETLYLLTTTAEKFFARLGYMALPRSKAPAAIAATVQFLELCPASSAFMRKALAGDHSLQS